MIGPKTANRLFAPDQTMIMIGAKGAGKTNFASVLMELLVSYGYNIYTNIHFFKFDELEEAIKMDKLKAGIPYRKKPDEIHIVSSLYKLLLGLVGEGKKVVFLDEAGIHASSSQPMSKTTVSIKQLAYIIRHFDACLVLISQTKGSIPPDLREKLIDYQIRVLKLHRSASFGKRDVVEDEFGVEHIKFPEEMGFQKISHSVYPYDSKFPTGFELDIDLKKALAELSKLGNSLEVMKHGKKVIEKLHKGSVKPPGPTKKDLIFKEYDMENFDYESLAKKYGTTNVTLRGYKCEWKKKRKIS